MSKYRAGNVKGSTLVQSFVSHITPRDHHQKLMYWYERRSGAGLREIQRCIPYSRVCVELVESSFSFDGVGHLRDTAAAIFLPIVSNS